ncbi:MAG TPA: hypothetical protein VHM28_10470, partial [Anaerolineales bacterium]|nr:hypothetical protein [Anaerolineales bacterium]
MNTRGMILILVGTLIVSACGTEVKTPEPLTVENAASTLVALTFEAATQAASLSTPIPSPLPSPTAPPLLYFNGNAKCRTGPGVNFRVIGTFTLGATVELLGRDTAASAWLVKIPNST